MLGDVLCSSPQCTTGEAQINEMDSVYQSAPQNVQAQFQGDHDSIMNSFNAIYGMLTNYIPFNPDCCTISDLGNQADTLKNEILHAMGQTGTQIPQGQGLNLTTILILAGAGYLALVYFAGRR